MNNIQGSTSPYIEHVYRCSLTGRDPAEPLPQMQGRRPEIQKTEPSQPPKWYEARRIAAKYGVYLEEWGGYEKDNLHRNNQGF